MCVLINSWEMDYTYLPYAPPINKPTFHNKIINKNIYFFLFTTVMYNLTKIRIQVYLGSYLILYNSKISERFNRSTLEFSNLFLYSSGQV